MMLVGLYDFDILSDMFITGADQKTAELRISEIRGVLRWWFRVLGGFKSEARSVKEQERMIFGSVHGEKCMRSQLLIRVEEKKLNANVKEANDYFLFPLNKNGRGYFAPAQKAFKLHVLWNGDKSQEENLKALITIFGNLGSLGMRTRRCYGAIAFSDNNAPMSLKEALEHFNTPNAIEIKAYNEPFRDVNLCIQKAMAWLKGWRSVGPSNFRNQGPGKDFAWRDHDIGLDRNDHRPAVRPALGMPIIQKYSSVKKSNNWNMVKPAERFSSPVILRPFKSIDGKIQLLTIFVECYKWAVGEMVEINKRSHDVSLELYNAMKQDSELINFTL